MYNTNLNIRTDEEIKKKAEMIFDALGMSTSTAVNIFLRQVVRANGLPFEVRLDVPNETTLGAIEEGRRIAYDKNVVGYSTADELKAAFDEI